MTPANMAAVNRGALIQQLRKVTEPCSIAMRNPIDIVEMGLVEDVEFIGGLVRVSLCLTDPGCIHLASLRQFITDVLLEVPGVQSVDVRQTATTLWTPDRIGRELAGE
jgi:metal-sulfur cluster biosynthetic enzyme